MDKKEKTEKLLAVLKSLMDNQSLAVLATHDHGQPYTSLVAFAASEDMKRLFFVTGMATRKYNNLIVDPRASMLIDSRANTPMDISRAMAATATGSVEMVSGENLDRLKNIFLKKHPHLSGFVASASTRLIRLNVACYYVVNRFQNVVELHMGNGFD